MFFMTRVCISTREEEGVLLFACPLVSAEYCRGLWDFRPANASFPFNSLRCKYRVAKPFVLDFIQNPEGAPTLTGQLRSGTRHSSNACSKSLLILVQAVARLYRRVILGGGRVANCEAQCFHSSNQIHYEKIRTWNSQSLLYSCKHGIRISSLTHKLGVLLEDKIWMT